MTRLTRCDDGKYRWCYSLDLFRRPKVLYSLLKFYGILFGILYVLCIIFADAMTYDKIPSDPLAALYGFFAVFTAFALVTAAFYYSITAARGNMRLFTYEMDEDGIHSRTFRVPKEVREKLPEDGMTVSYANAEKFIASCRPGFESHESFERIRRILIKRGTDTIRLRSPFYSFSLCIFTDDLDTVDSFIRDHSERMMFNEKRERWS